MSILIDYNGVAVANIVTQKLNLDENLLRHMILNSIRTYRAKFRNEYGEVVICCDAGNNWRKEVFPQYKFKRKKSREDSPFDWGTIFDVLNKVRDELAENFPYKVMHIDRCEADDIIAQLAIHTQEFGNYEKVMIVSSDKDFAQLQVMDNVHQYSPMKKNRIVEKNPRRELLKHILTGDASDGVPNVLSDDDCFVESRRQRPVRSKLIENVLLSEDPVNNEHMSEEMKRNFFRNKKMIDLWELPSDLKREIINTFENQDPIENKSKVLNYLIQNNCRRLIEDIGDFI